ncbi:HPP family protein [Phyllobacterium sp. YR531]|uniref:HPP family protein n=1 Tax=Phyllobacterium sp. YR531 TaxID=1144343 RepID=UPI00026F8F8E|nr:HPP family protein [Phyllobacterium sp. YR531]EJN06087.1 CBS-domain-containing membrane protein [Phyllobacterium sp. YR531]
MRQFFFSKGPDGTERFRLFVPILAGATLRERIIGCIGALIGIGLTGWICGALFGSGPAVPLIVAPVGASAVLLFAVPASPLAQPWPIIGGNTISALVGVTVAHFVHQPELAIALAVALAIAVMSVTRSLHPPGGAAALTAIIGGPAVLSSGFLFPFVPVALNSVLLVALGVVFHRLAGRSYPHKAAAPATNTHGTQDPPAPLRSGFQSEDVDNALQALDETFDIERSDLDVLLREVQVQAAVRRHRALLCGDIMSRDVIKVSEDTSADEARNLLLAHNIRALPVLDHSGRLLGTVGLRELASADTSIRESLSPAVTAKVDDHAMKLLPMLTDGTTHAVIIVDESRLVLGLITQTDLLGVAFNSYL